MKIKTSQISIRKIGLIVPVLAYFLINGVFTMLTTLSARIFSLQSFASSVGQTIPYLSIFTVTCSYLSCHLYTKKKVWGYYGFILSFAFISLFYYLKSDNDYGIMLWVISYFLYSSVTGILLYILYDWFQKKEKQKELKRQNLQSELNLLKNQLNPHFLLNTLNNIYALIAFDTDKAQQAVQELSKLLRYVLYDNQQTYVPLGKETDFIRNYIELMRIRLSSNVQMTTQIDIQPDSQTLITPLIFISLIENAFKHGISPTERSFIHIHLAENETEVICEISNSNHPKNIMDKSGSGIGLEQVNRRLEILYPGQYTWQKGISEDGKEYKSRLSIRVRESINK